MYLCMVTILVVWPYTIGSIESNFERKMIHLLQPKSEMQFYFEIWNFIEFLMTKKVLKTQNLSQLRSKNYEITFIKPYLFIEGFPTIWRKHLSVPKFWFYWIFNEKNCSIFNNSCTTCLNIMKPHWYTQWMVR
jgi:hypothetical protein